MTDKDSSLEQTSQVPGPSPRPMCAPPCKVQFWQELCLLGQFTQNPHPGSESSPSIPQGSPDHARWPAFSKNPVGEFSQNLLFTSEDFPL